MENKEKWIMQNLTISLQAWGEKKGQYTGSVKFSNGVKMDINFLLDEGKCERFITILQDEIISHAQLMSNLLVTSMPKAIPEPEVTKSDDSQERLVRGELLG